MGQRLIGLGLIALLMLGGGGALLLSGGTAKPLPASAPLSFAESLPRAEARLLCILPEASAPHEAPALGAETRLTGR